jgi:hypothetical protein
MRGTIISIVAVCLAVVSVQHVALGKKNKKDRDARLRSLQTIYVDGSGTAVSYVRKNLSEKTCLLSTPERSEADAVLDIEEGSPVPCGMGVTGGMCTSLTAQLTDAKTDEALWLTADEHIPLTDVIHQLHAPGDWVLWNLKNACCKDRPIPAHPKDPAP